MEEYEKIIKYQFDSYCKKVIKRTACKMILGHKKRVEHELSIDLLQNYTQNFAVFDFEGEYLLEELLKLDKRSIEIIFAYYIYGMTCEDIAKKMGMTSQNISILKNKALKKLRYRLENRG
ncbi:sigma-70 family RNA polymerase sigma factor [Enterococcus cecorum]|uniref:RNA polymerase sigma-70 region 4 domain-containing protein n=1 Tax=Enterococcus cecorum TaxID=44008 RepID=A0A200I5G4_9ENTE|nr:sigma-70 family RNA polymerase sigma factor [Enterococcus cecorum]OUZ19547.1 hypothetical protein A5869_001201 [Enterococcus cecorum]